LKVFNRMIMCSRDLCLVSSNDSSYQGVDYATYNVTSFIITTGQANSSDEKSLKGESAVGLIILYTITTVLSIVGNSFVILVFVRGRRSRTDLRPFLINLAISDLIMAIFCMPFSFIYAMLDDWIFSEVMCVIVLFVQILAVCGSVFTNMAIGIDRFMAVMFPLRSRLTKKRARYVIMLIWLACMAVSSVQFQVAGTYDNSGRTVCTEMWSDEKQRKIYTVSVFVITYVVPLVILSITYTIVGILLWKRTSPGNRDHARDMQQLRSKRKVLVCMFNTLTSKNLKSNITVLRLLKE